LKDVVLVAILVLAFASVVTAHVAITFGLARSKPRWRALVAFVLVPLAPYWAWRAQMRKRTWLWIGSLVLYLAALIVASF
jgi:hypothetical protein